MTADENKKGLEEELVRLKTASWFLAKFKAYAKDMNVEIFSGKSHIEYP